MLNYVINLLDDVSAKGLPCGSTMLYGAGGIQSWSQTDKIDRLQRTHAQRHLVGQGNTSKTQNKGLHFSGRVLHSVYFNRSACMQKHTTETKGVLYKHICSS